MASSNRIFIGNIAYNATEEEVKALCAVVGPVVSFRIVTDKDTGKPKGFGFCEYRDEATAFSALRNLQDCEFHGRRLKVNFAANEKSNHQPIGLEASVDAAIALGGQGLASDALTVCLSTMSRNQLAQMVSEMKGIAVGNKEMAHELLLSKPQLNRALLQAQIMLGMVTPQMMDKANLRPIPNVSKPEPHIMVPKSEISEPHSLGAEVDHAMLLQVANLPPETVATLSPELRQQVIQIQQMYRLRPEDALSIISSSARNLE